MMSMRLGNLLGLGAIGFLLTALPAAASTPDDGALDLQIFTFTGGGGDCEPGDDCGGGGGCEPGDDCGGGGGGGGGDDDLRNVLKFDERSYFAIEGGAVAVITVERSHGEDGAVSVTYATAGGTATAGSDYTPVTGTLSWPAGNGATLTFTIPLLDDGVAEGNETVELVLSNPTGGATLDPERSTAVLTIGDQGGGDVPPGGDDDRPGTFKFSERGFQVIEGQPFATIGVERSHGEAGAASVAFAATAGSAADGEDFQGVAGVLSWGAGDGSTKTFQVPVLPDAVSEGTETVNLVLSDPTGGAVVDGERGSALLAILDDDASTAACVPGADLLCLQAGRFSAEITFRTPNVPGGNGRARAVPVSSQAGLFWFFDSSNAEMLIKVIDTCGVPGFDAYWVFYAATTNVDFTLTVTDHGTGVAKQYFNPLGRTAEPVQDVLTFACI
jgi:hypothetical protein